MATAAVGVGIYAVKYAYIRRSVRFPYLRLALTKSERSVASPGVPNRGAQAGGLNLPPDQYPEVHRGTHSDVLHGREVADPYRWLEDQTSDEAQQYIERQNALTRRVLSRCEGREQLKGLVSKILDHPRHGIPFKRGGLWFFFSNSGLQNQDVLYTAASPEECESADVFLDPNKLSEDGTVALGTVAFSYDGSKLAYMLSESGSDWKSIRAARINGAARMEQLNDVIKHVRYSGLSWAADGSGFFYSGYEPPPGGDLGTENDAAVNQKLYFHRLGTPQASDVLLYAEPVHPTWMIGARVSDGGRWLWLTVSTGTQPANKALVCDLSALPRASDGASADFSRFQYDADAAAARLPLVRLADDFSASWSLVAAEGSVLTLLTNAGAPRKRLVALDMATARGGDLSSGRFRVVLPQHPRDLLQDATPLRGDLAVVQWMRDVVDMAELRRLSDGALICTVPLPAIGTMSNVVTEPHRASTEFFFSLTSFVEPAAIYRADAASLELAGTSGADGDADAPPPPPPPHLLRRARLTVEHDPAAFETKQVFVRSRDGTRVPMFLVHAKDFTPNGEGAALLYGYGGFNISLQPRFSATWLAWLKATGGVFALANIRGGGEYGRAWRDDGSRTRKQNVFDDFQACAAWLSDEGYCARRSLAIQGGSNGGLLVAACANQRPDLFGCVLCQVGVLDMLRFHKFTIGHAWQTDFGSPDNEEEFEVLRGYSPYHNVACPSDGGQYPAMLLLTASHDDRVSPLHTYKHLAELQHQLACVPSSVQSNPLVARIETKAGHGAGTPTAKIIEEAADMLAFAVSATAAPLHL